MLLAKLFPDEQYDKKPRHDTDSRATLRAGVHRIYLPAPLDAHAWAEVQIGLSPRFQLAGCEFQAPQKCLRLIMVYAISFIP
jgi:hypothetical protein